MGELMSAEGSIALALTALLLVVGYRIARPERAREWAALAAYALALAAQLLGARGLLPGPAPAPAPALRLGGAALLVLGLLLAGQPSRARRRAAGGGRTQPAPVSRAFDPVYAGLALVLLGQLLRAPSLAGAIAVSLALLVEGWVAATPRRRAEASP